MDETRKVYTADDVVAALRRTAENLKNGVPSDPLIDIITNTININPEIRTGTVLALAMTEKLSRMLGTDPNLVAYLSGVRMGVRLRGMLNETSNQSNDNVSGVSPDSSPDNRGIPVLGDGSTPEGHA